MENQFAKSVCKKILQKNCIQVLILDNSMRNYVPKYSHEQDAGADICISHSVVIEPNSRKLVKTGIAILIPNGFVGLIHPRSGLAVKKGLSIVNSPGTIDAGYTGELCIPLLNTDCNNPIKLEKFDRIAQLVLQKVERANFVIVDSFQEKNQGKNNRGINGFGSTGINNN